MNLNKEVRFYNVIFPVWMLLMIPVLWAVVIVGNFIVDTIVLLVALAVMKIAEKKHLYKKLIFKIYAFGLLSDVIGAVYMLAMMVVFRIGNDGDEWYLTVPGLLIAAALIFVFNYFVSFRKLERPLRFKLALTFAVVTAPYTFLIPNEWTYSGEV